MFTGNHIIIAEGINHKSNHLSFFITPNHYNLRTVFYRNNNKEDS